MRILVTGAGGQLGQDVVAAAARAGHAVTACGHGALDVTEERAIAAVVDSAAPEAIVNCAAYTDVDGAEANEPAATRVNGAAAGVLARAAASAGALLVHVSTDYVFDGEASRDYVESDPTAPLSAYGRSKLAGEQAVAASGARHAIVRTSWLFGPGGGNFVETMLRLAGEREELAVVDDQVGCPTFTGHLAPALVQIVERPLTGVRHVAAAGHCSWNRFAAEIFRQAQMSCSVRASSTADLGRPAPRPARSVLVSEHDDTPRLPDWREGLSAYLAQRGAPAMAPGAAR